MIDFTQLDYLASGNSRQRQAYADLNTLDIFILLNDFNPLLAGTIPIGIDIEDSDLDIICCCSDHDRLTLLLTDHLNDHADFECYTSRKRGKKTTVARFRSAHFPIEIFAQDQPSYLQPAFQHMLLEYKILQERGADFKKEIIKLKQSGIKTEPAFAQLLGLKGDPYKELLDFWD